MAGVKTQHAGYQAQRSNWEKARDVIAGEKAIHDKGEIYLPKLHEQTMQSYNAMVARTPFVNFSWRTVSAFQSMLFRKPPKITANQKLKDLLKDVTSTGINFETLAQDCAYENLVTSRVGIYVDRPEWPKGPDGKPEKLSVDEAEKRGLRPYMKIYPTESIINWKLKLVNNRFVISQVVLVEQTEVSVDEFEVRIEAQYRVLDLDNNGDYRVRLFDHAENFVVNSERWPTLNNQRLKEIPFYVMGPNGVSIDCDDPILIDLFNLNVQHYQVSADYERACHITAAPTPYITGYTFETGVDGKRIPPKIYVGSETALVLENAEAKVGYMEYTGQGIEPIKNNLELKESQMAAIGARVIAQEKAGVEAFKTIAMRSASENSVLSNIAISTSYGLKLALEMFAKWADLEQEVEVELNTQFLPVPMDAPTAAAYMNMVTQGRMSPQTFHDVMTKADVFDVDKPFEKEQAEIENFLSAQLEKDLERESKFAEITKPDNSND